MCSKEAVRSHTGLIEIFNECRFVQFPAWNTFNEPVIVWPLTRDTESHLNFPARSKTILRVRFQTEVP